MGLTTRTRNEVQFVELMQRTRALDDTSWRKPHFYEHLKKLHAQLKETPGLTADDRVSYEKSMIELDKIMANISQPKPERPSQISELIHRRRTKVEEQQKLKTPEKYSAPGFKSDSDQPSSNVVRDEYEPEQDVTEVLKQHKERQSKLADQMLAMTQNLKQVSVAARDIIKQDNQNLSEVHDVVDKNTAKLSKGHEQQKLLRRNCSRYLRCQEIENRAKMQGA